MFVQMLHYPYRLRAQALDVAGRNLHGTVQGVGFEPDGISTGSGALRFNSSSSRVRVLNRDAFKALFALKIELVVRVEAWGQRQNLVEGHLSFAFFIGPDGILCGTARDRPALQGTGEWLGTDSANGSPDGNKRTVPVGRWVKLTYLHDGYANLQLYIDDKLVASTSSLPAPLQQVGHLGVHIGNWPDADAYPLQGLLDDTIIWKWDPLAVSSQFYSRSSNAGWTQLRRSLPSLVPRRDYHLSHLIGCVARQQYLLIQALRAQGEPALKRISEFAPVYRSLWSSEALDGEAMTELMRDIQNWLEEVAKDQLESTLRGLQGCFAEMGIDLEDLPHIDWSHYDTEFVAFIRNIYEGREQR